MGIIKPKLLKSFMVDKILLPQLGIICDHRLERIVGTISQQGYVVTTIGNNHYRMHRLIWSLKRSNKIKDDVIHHKNHARSDNRLNNLERISHVKNVSYREGRRESEYSFQRLKQNCQIVRQRTGLVLLKHDTKNLYHLTRDGLNNEVNSTKGITVRGQTFENAFQCAKHFKLNPSTVYQAVALGNTDTIGMGRRIKRKVLYRGNRKYVEQLCLDTGYSVKTIYNCIQSGRNLGGYPVKWA